MEVLPQQPPTLALAEINNLNRIKMNTPNLLGFLTEASDSKTIKFVATDANNGDLKDQHNRWFTQNAIKAAFEAGWLKATNDPNALELADGIRAFPRRDGCFGFTDKQESKRH